MTVMVSPLNARTFVSRARCPVIVTRSPALATLGIFTFIGSYNDFLGPLVFLDSVEKYTLPVGVALFQSSYITEYGLTLAASVICFRILHHDVEEKRSL